MKAEHITTDFWQDKNLSQLVTPLVQQITVCVCLNADEEARSELKQCLANFLVVATDETLTKSVNTGVLMLTRSESSRQRIFAIDCAHHLWCTNGRKLAGTGF